MVIMAMPFIASSMHRPGRRVLQLIDDRNNLYFGGGHDGNGKGALRGISTSNARSCGMIRALSDAAERLGEGQQQPVSDIVDAASDEQNAGQDQQRAEDAFDPALVTVETGH